MLRLRAWFSRLFGVFHKNRRDAEMAEEIRQHVDLLTERNLAAGMSPDEARNAALRQFGGLEQIKEIAREQRVWMWAHQLWQDVAFACRLLRKSPAFTLVALLTLMLGIGANIVVFGVVNAVLLHPLDVSDPQNLYQLRFKPWTSGKLLTTSYPAFGDIRQRNTTFSDIAGFNGFCQARLHWGDAVKSVSGYAVTGNYFDLLGVQAQVGRLIQAEDEHGPNSAPYIVLSDSLWRSAFNADPGVIGTTVRLNKDSFTVVGVTPAQFHGTERFDWPDYYIPIVNYFDSDYLQNRTGRPLTMLGRLKPGVTPQQATENLNAIAAKHRQRSAGPVLQ